MVGLEVLTLKNYFFNSLIGGEDKDRKEIVLLCGIYIHSLVLQPIIMRMCGECC